MSKLFSILIITFSLCFFISNFSSAQTNTPQAPSSAREAGCDYLNTPNTQTMKTQCETCFKAGGFWMKQSIPSFGNCVKYADKESLKKSVFIPLYKFSLSALAIVSLFMIVYGGYQYLTALGSDRSREGKKTITFAIGGLVLGLSSWLLLNIINHNLVSGYDNPLELKVQIRQAMDAIKKNAKLNAIRCEGTSVGPCQSKSIGDLCEENSSKGACAPEQNVIGNICSCKTTTCVLNNCNNGDPGCKGQKCYDNNKEGECISYLDQGVSKIKCQALDSACHNECGAGFESGINCLGQTCSNGICIFNQNYMEENTWYKCASLDEACKTQCGSDFTTGTNQNICNMKPCGNSGNQSCYSGSCREVLSGVLCAQSEDVGKLCNLGGGVYGTCRVVPQGQPNPGTYECASF